MVGICNAARFWDEDEMSDLWGREPDRTPDCGWPMFLDLHQMHIVMKVGKPPAPGLIDAIAKAIDSWREKRPDLTVDETLRALAVVGNKIKESAERHGL